MIIGQYQLSANTFSTAVVIALVLACMVTDLYQRRIPNCLTLPAVAFGLALGFISNGWKGLLMAELGLITGLGLLLLPYIYGGMGAGDVKLMAAVGALVSFPDIILVFLYTAIFGGVLAMFAALRRRVAMEALSNAVSLLIHRRLGTLFAQKASAKSAESVGAIPYGLAIGLGTFTFLLFGAIL